jgi:hypothetical protein
MQSFHVPAIFVVCIVALQMGATTLAFQAIPCTIGNRKSLDHKFSCPQLFIQRRTNIVRPDIKLRANNKPDDEKNREEPDRTLSFQRSDNGTRDSEFWMDRSDGNPFYQVISSLTPGELVGQFINSASPRVQASPHASSFFLPLLSDTVHDGESSLRSKTRFSVCSGACARPPPSTPTSSPLSGPSPT